MNRLLKQALVVIASACSGFYLGGRYVGGLAIQEYVAQKPAWLVTAQGTMQQSLVLAGVAAVAWIVFDYTQRRDGE